MGAGHSVAGGLNSEAFKFISEISGLNAFLVPTV
jgi:hypothetical protein